MHNLNESTIEWNYEQFWIKFAYHEQFGLLQKRPNISIININETGREQIDETGKIKLIDITFLILVIFTIVFVFVTLTIKVLCQRLNEKDFDIEYLETLNRKIAASRAFPAVRFGKPTSKFINQSIYKSINKSINKSDSKSISLSSQKTGPMSIPVQSSAFSIKTLPIGQDKSSSDLQLNISTLKGKISVIPSKQSDILPVNESKYASKNGADKVPSSNQSFPDAAPLSKQSLDFHSGYRLSSSSFDNYSGELPRNLSMSLGISREDFVSVLSDRDSYETDNKPLKLESKKSKITSGLLQNSKTSKQADSDSSISHSSLKDNLEKPSYQSEEMKTLSVNEPTRDKVSKIHQDSYPFGSSISKSSKSPKSHGEIQSRALLSVESRRYNSVAFKAHKPRALPPRGSWKSTKTNEKNVKHDSPKHAN